MVGGGGETKTLLLAARYADACNVFASNPDDVAHKLEVLRPHCDAEDTSFAAIQKTALYNKPVLEAPDAFLAAAEQTPSSASPSGQ